MFFQACLATLIEQGGMGVLVFPILTNQHMKLRGSTAAEGKKKKRSSKPWIEVVLFQGLVSHPLLLIAEVRQDVRGLFGTVEVKRKSHYAFEKK